MSISTKQLRQIRNSLVSDIERLHIPLSKYLPGDAEYIIRDTLKSLKAKVHQIDTLINDSEKR